MKLRDDHVPLILFSGGLDSTYLLLDAVLHFRRVDVLKVSLVGQDAKSIREKQACDEILRMLDEDRIAKEKDDPEHPHGYVRRTYNPFAPGTMQTMSHRILLQPVIWMWAAMSSIDIRLEHKEVWIGYVKGDDMIGSLPYLRAAWENLVAACYVDNDGKSYPELMFPLRGMGKLKLIRDIAPKYLSAISWCESMEEGNDCGLCSSCRRMMDACLSMREFYPHAWETSPLKSRYDKMYRALAATLSINDDQPKDITNDDLAQMVSTHRSPAG